MKEGWAVVTQCFGGLCGIGSEEATCAAEMPTKIMLWAQTQTRLTDRKANTWKKELKRGR